MSCTPLHVIVFIPLLKLSTQFSDFLKKYFFASNQMCIIMIHLVSGWFSLELKTLKDILKIPVGKNYTFRIKAVENVVLCSNNCDSSVTNVSVALLVYSADVTWAFDIHKIRVGTLYETLLLVTSLLLLWRWVQ